MRKNLLTGATFIALAITPGISFADQPAPAPAASGPIQLHFSAANGAAVPPTGAVQQSSMQQPDLAPVDPDAAANQADARQLDKVSAPATRGYAAAPSVQSPPNQGPITAPPSGTSAATWSHLVKAPAEGRESFATQDDAIRALVAAQQAGSISNLPPIASSDGTVLYPYGQSWPTVVTSPLNLTIIQLAPGDKPDDVALGEPGEWRVAQSMAGDQPILAVSPRFAGLHTNLMVTATSATGEARVYYINLVSAYSNFIPKIGFYFPDELSQKWSQQTQEQSDSTVAALPSLSARNLDFSWNISCGGGGWFTTSACGSIKPVRVFDDGVHTYIQLIGDQANTVGLPTVLATNTAGDPALINYRVKDGYYILDGVPAKIIMKSGVGSDGLEVNIVHAAAQDQKRDQQ